MNGIIPGAGRAGPFFDTADAPLLVFDPEFPSTLGSACAAAGASRGERVICPQCRSEYRPGYVRCSSCGVDLVPEDRAEVAVRSAAIEPEVEPETEAPVLEADLFPFCGFLTLEDARHAREELRQAGIPSDVLIREVGRAERTEEYWIRVPRHRFAQVATVLGEEAGEEAASGGNGEVADAETFACSECGEDVAGDADECPHCGARFDI